MFAGIVLIAAFVFCCFPSDSVLASEKPPFTDYCQRLEQEVQGRKHGFLAAGAFNATMAHEPRHVEQYLEAAAIVFGEIREATERGDVMARIGGQPKHTMFARLTN